MKIAVTTLLLLAAVASHAQVHKCVDAAGKVSYSEAPCGAAAKQSQQMMGREATSTYDPYAAQRTMESYERATAISRSINDGPAIAQPDAGGGAIDAGRTGARQPQSNFVPRSDDEAQTTSTRKGPIGGSRDANPNWSPRRGYYGGGGPADQRYEAEQEALRREAAARTAAQGPLRANNCDANGCWMSSGERFNRTGDGSRLVGPSGQSCRSTGGGWFSCN